ncbi:hypothetical protein SPSIL_005120 [Sporomusa silvacetica DSM 10669]|uniref:DUF5698 domain-containing protein n=1 Tax=Sporomusa silvacetica DSM 10669 TaxID=1123289 RepID=A0ABZ3IFK4_9FIRM|nr:hypothetical protein [Sporomusa silvacetica]OZC23550.1 hypothetical protein SPSIL_02010 [Sporomusa silvacetica DSM 10669]
MIIKNNDSTLFIGLKELFLILVYVGVFIAFLRRTVLKTARLENTAEAFAILGFIDLIVTGDLLYNSASFAMGENAGVRWIHANCMWILGLI